jgi:chorismate dehydratase
MIKIGMIAYSNLFPIYYHLLNMKSGDYQFIEGVPSELNSLLRDRRIDISPSSSIEYLRRPDQYIVIPGHSVSSEGSIGSILLFSREPIENLHGHSVLYSYQSETSVALLSIIFSQFLNIDCELKLSKLPLYDGLKNYPAYLMIGDDALLESLKKNDLFIYDLGDMWYGETGLPFVFALWIANRGSEESAKVFQADLDRAKELAAMNLPEVAKVCPMKQWLSEERLISYWERLSYDFDSRHTKGLELFSKYLKELKLI